MQRAHLPHGMTSKKKVVYPPLQSLLCRGARKRGICARTHPTIQVLVEEEIEVEIMAIIGCRGFKLEPSVEPMGFLLPLYNRVGI